jgi:murein DD-endopeptidase MepM/ murein hydrolase activator NlpD
MNRVIGLVILLAFCSGIPWVEARPAVVNLAIGEAYTYTTQQQVEKKITLLALRETRDRFRDAVRWAEVDLDVNGQPVTVPVALYTLPVVVQDIKVDVPVSKGYIGKSSHGNVWGFPADKDIRLRVWDADQPLLEPGTFCYPVQQRWFASDTQMANEPCYVDAAEDPTSKTVYYHYGLDFGGYDRMIPVVAATDGQVISVAGETLPGMKEKCPNLSPRYDVVYIMDKRGWYYRYSHMDKILPHVQLGSEVKMGDWIAILGKEGASGGWSHLHFEPNGTEGAEAGLINGYPFVVEAYLNAHPNALLANARPHRIAAAGEPVVLSGEHSICQGGEILSYAWDLTNGEKAEGPTVEMTYDKPGVYSEILRVKDNRGREDVDFAVVQVFAADNQGEALPPAVNVTYWPTFGNKPNSEVFFKARTFRVQGGKELWDFGDGTHGETESLNEYATISHHYKEPGMYIVTVQRTSDNGYTAMARVKVIVE